MAVRCFLFKKCTGGFVQGINYFVSKRTFIRPDKLGVTDYLQRRRILNQVLGDQKEKFISRIESSVSDGQQISKDDVRKLLHLADTKELQNLSIKSVHLYLNQQRASGTKYLFVENELILEMLSSNQEIDEALHQFYDEEVEEVEQRYRNTRCFSLMMDMLYRAERYEDVIWLYSKSKEIFLSENNLLSHFYFGSQYQLGTREALSHVQAELNEFLNQEITLGNRCLFLASMLAFKLQDYTAMLEMQSLPVFSFNANVWGTENNLKLLAYVHLDREEEAVSLLQSLLVLTKSTGPLYSDVDKARCSFQHYYLYWPKASRANVMLDTVKEKVLNGDNSELKASLLEIELALNKENLIRFETFDRLSEYPTVKRRYSCARHRKILP